MELHEPLELTDHLLREATSQKEFLAQTMSARQQAGTEGSSNAPGRSYHPEPYTLQEEHALWEKAHHGLTVVRNALVQIEQSKRQRGVRP
jgi:hypothetical protein